MNNEVFQQAQTAYNSKDYATALQLFATCLNGSQQFQPGESGLLCHQMGNCLMKLNNNAEAINAYSQATADAAYGAMGAVNCNMGFAYAALRDYENAVKCFSAAAADARYESRHKAYSGMGSALLKLGKTAEAGVAFREAALDDANPDPTKALLNLGICFMTLNRPNDAVTSYESALQFPMKASTRNKLYANLGQAYVACGQMQKAVNAFEQALADKTYFLSDSASVDYQRAIGNVAQGTMEIPKQPEPEYGDASGFDVVSDPFETGNYYDDDPYDPGRYEEDSAAGYLPSGSPDADQDAFFNASDEEVENWSRNIEVQKKKGRGCGFKIFITFMVLVVLALGAAIFAYTQGMGYPTQQSVVQQFFADPQNADSVIASGISDKDKAAMLSAVVADANAKVEGVNSSMSNSTAYVTATTQGGGAVRYQVSLVRDALGWKVSDVELYFTSQN